MNIGKVSKFTMFDPPGAVIDVPKTKSSETGIETVNCSLWCCGRAAATHLHAPSGLSCKEGVMHLLDVDVQQVCVW